MTTKTKPETEEPPRRGYHAPDYDPVNVYGHRDIPVDFPPKWRTALSLLVSGPKRKDTISIMTGSPAGEPWRYHSCRTDSLMATLTDKVGNLCEGEDGLLALVSPDGQSFVGGLPETARTIAERKAACYNSAMGARQ